MSIGQQRHLPVRVPGKDGQRDLIQRKGGGEGLFCECNGVFVSKHV